MKKKLADIFLYKKAVFEKITSSRKTFYLGILAVGMIDIALFVFARANLFFGSENPNRMYNIFIGIIAVLLIGAVDVLFFSIPIKDLLRKFRREDKLADMENKVVKIGKIYVLAHLPVLPLNIIYLVLYNNLAADISNPLWYLVLIIDLIVPFWFAAIISRGINSIYNFAYLFKKMVFFVVFIWSFLLGYAISYMLSNWVVLLFKG